MRRSPVPYVLGLLAACGSPRPLPADKATYIGTWTAVGVELRIDADRSVIYDRRLGRGTQHVAGKILSWNGEDFVVGVLTVKTTVEVAQPPHKVGQTWTMNVDGVDLFRFDP